jgi:hypothetical protein
MSQCAMNFVCLTWRHILVYTVRIDHGHGCARAFFMRMALVLL